MASPLSPGRPRRKSDAADSVRSTVLNQHLNPVTYLSEKEIESLLNGMTPVFDSDDEGGLPVTTFRTIEEVRKALTKTFGMCGSLLLSQVADTIWEMCPRRGEAHDELQLADFFYSFEEAEKKRLAIESSPSRHQSTGGVTTSGTRFEDTSIKMQATGTETLPLASTMKLQAQFHALDLNGDGVLDEHEVTQALGNTFPSADEETLRQLSGMMTTGADSNSDGCIDLDEFISYFVKSQADRLQSVEKLRARSSEFLTVVEKERSGFREDPLSHLSPPQVEELLRSFTHYNPDQFEHHYLDREEVEEQVKTVFGLASEPLLEDLVEVLFDTADRKEGFKGIRIDPSLFFKMFVEEASKTAAYHLGGLGMPGPALVGVPGGAAHNGTNGGAAVQHQRLHNNQLPRLTRPASSNGMIPIGGLGQEDVDLLRDTFISLDTNGDGLVGPEEIENALRVAFNKPLGGTSSSENGGGEAELDGGAAGPTVADFDVILGIAAEKFKAADLDLDKMLSLTEFLNSFQLGLGEGVIPLQVVEVCVAGITVRLSDDEVFALQQSFAYYDKNGDGFLDKVELFEMVRETTLKDGESSSEARVVLVESIVGKADRDKDDQISLSEFLRAMQEDLQVFPPILLYPRTMQLIDQIPEVEHKHAICGILATLPISYMAIDSLAEAIQETIEACSLEEIDMEWLELLTEALLADASADDTITPPTFSVKRIVQRIAQTSWVDGFPVQPPPSRGSRPPLAPGSRSGRSNNTPPSTSYQQQYYQNQAQQQQPYPVPPPLTEGDRAPGLARISSYIDPETPRPKGRGRRVSTGDSPSVSSSLKLSDSADQQDSPTSNIASPTVPLGSNVEVTHQTSGDFVLHVADQVTDLGKLFAFLDEDDDGFISHQEPHIYELAYTLMKQRHSKWTDKAIAAIIDSLFNAADLDEDGKLNATEFIESFTSGYGVLPDDYVQDVVPRLVKPLTKEDYSNLARVLTSVVVAGQDASRSSSCDVHGMLMDSAMLKRQLFELLEEVYVGDTTTIKALIIGTITVLENQPQPSVAALVDNLLASLETNNVALTSQVLAVPNILDDEEMALALGSDLLVIGGNSTANNGAIKTPTPPPTPKFEPAGESQVLVIDDSATAAAEETTNSEPGAGLAQEVNPGELSSTPATNTMDDYLDLEEGKLTPLATRGAGMPGILKALKSVVDLTPEDGLIGEELVARLTIELLLNDHFHKDAPLRQSVCSAVVGHCPRKKDDDTLLDVKELAAVFPTNKGLLCIMEAAVEGDGGQPLSSSVGGVRDGWDSKAPLTASLHSPIGTTPANDVVQRIQECEEALIESTAALGVASTQELFSLLAKVLLQQDTRRDGLLQYKPLREAIGVAFASNVVPIIVQCICEGAEAITGDTLNLLLFIRHFVPKYHCYTPGVKHQAQHPEQPLMATRSITLSERLQCEEALHAFSTQIQAAGNGTQAEPSNMGEALRGHLFTSSPLFRETFGDDLLTMEAFAEVVAAAFEKSPCSSLSEYLKELPANAPKRPPLVPSPPLLPSKVRQEILTRKLILHLRKDECRTLLRCLLRGDTHGDGKVSVDRLTSDLVWEWSENAGANAEESPSVVVDTILDLILPALDIVEGSSFTASLADSAQGGDLYLCADVLIPLLCDYCPLIGADHVAGSVLCRLINQPTLPDDAIAAVTSSFAMIDVERQGFPSHEQLKNTVAETLRQTRRLPVTDDASVDRGELVLTEASCQAIATFLDNFAVEVLGGPVLLTAVLRCITVVPEGIAVAAEHILPTSAAANGVWRCLGVKKIRDIAASFTTLDGKADRYLDMEELETELTKEYRRRISDTDLKSPARRRFQNNAEAVVDVDEERERLQRLWVSETFQANDLDQDGLLSLEEYLASFVDTLAWASQGEEQSLAPAGHVTTGIIPYTTVVRLNRARNATSELNINSVHRTPPASLVTTTSSTTTTTTAANLSPMQTRQRGVTEVPVMDDELQAEFRSFDKDNNGYLSRAEFKAVYKGLENFGCEPSDAQVESLFNECCTASGSVSGQINFTAFSLLMLKRSKM